MDYELVPKSLADMFAFPLKVSNGRRRRNFTNVTNNLTVETIEH